MGIQGVECQSHALPCSSELTPETLPGGGAVQKHSLETGPNQLL